MANSEEERTDYFVPRKIKGRNHFQAADGTSVCTCTIHPAAAHHYSCTLTACCKESPSYPIGQGSQQIEIAIDHYFISSKID
jgi:hypothetical protein